MTLSEDRYLIADSHKGVIWSLDPAAPRAEIWLEHPQLARSIVVTNGGLFLPPPTGVEPAQVLRLQLQ